MSLCELIIIILERNYTIKQILTHDGAWWKFYEKHQHRIRLPIIIAVLKLISCKNIIRGVQEFSCPNQSCSYVKWVCFTCKSKACSSCGKKATAIWLNKQFNVLPRTPFQHITFTMPDVLWDFFWYNRYLLNLIALLAVDCIKRIAKKKKVTPGIFIAIHTFGRDLKRNVHIHLSVTIGGLSDDNTKWIKLFFNRECLMKQWRYNIINFFRDEFNRGNLIIPSKISQTLNHTFTFNNFLGQQYQKYWHVHCAKPSNSYKKDLKYLSRYIKRPPIAESRLKHYDGNYVAFKYLDHKTKIFRHFKLTTEDFIAKFISHIHDVNFRTIRYYGFLSNRLISDLLPKVKDIIGQHDDKQLALPGFQKLMIDEFNVDPFKCLFCGCQLVLNSVRFGISSAKKLLTFHRELALLKNI